MAAVSPDARWVAVTTGRDAVFILDAGTGFSLRALPLTGLVSWEAASAWDLRWCANSEYLTFTEVHNHPAESSHPTSALGPLRPSPRTLNSSGSTR